MQSKSEVKDLIFDFIYETALRDASLQKAYNGEKKPLFKLKQPRDLIKSYINALLDGDNPDFYETASQIEKKFCDEGFAFTFGNTQKLINMTVKYVYIAAYQDGIYMDLREKFRKCHCPMDSIMIEKVIKVIIDQTHKPEVREILKGHERNWRGFLRSPWSKINNENIEQYKMFQKLVKYLSNEAGFTPIEYDYKIWNHEATQGE